MSCCWRPVAHQRPLSANGRAPAPNSLGAIPLVGREDAAPYGGESRGETIYLVGWRTEHERLFLGVHAKDAVVYRNKTDRNLRLDPVAAGQLPAPAIEELLSGTR